MEYCFSGKRNTQWMAADGQLWAGQLRQHELQECMAINSWELGIRSNCVTAGTRMAAAAVEVGKVDKLGGVHLGKQHTRMKVAFEFGSWVFEPKAMGRRSHGSAIPDAWALRYLC